MGPIFRLLELGCAAVLLLLMLRAVGLFFIILKVIIVPILRAIRSGGWGWGADAAGLIIGYSRFLGFEYRITLRRSASCRELNLEKPLLGLLL